MKRQSCNVGLAVVFASCAAVVVAAEPVPSATLKQLQGRVFLGQGKSMGLAQEGMSVYAGNRVATVSGGEATVVYPDGCSVNLPENSLLIIGGAEQCRANQAMVRATAGFSQKSIGQTYDDRKLAELINQNPEELVNAYNRLDAAEKIQLVNQLTTEQLSKLYVAIGEVSGQTAAEAFLGTLSAAQVTAVSAAVGTAATAGAGFVIGGVTVSAATVGALAGIAATVALAVVGATQTNNQESGLQTSENPPASK